MQLCKCLNCFLKAHNKQLNQYFLNFIIFFLPNGQGRVDPQKTWVKSWVNLFLLQVKKIRFGLGIFWVGSENFDPFCHVYLHGNKLDNQIIAKLWITKIFWSVYLQDNYHFKDLNIQKSSLIYKIQIKNASKCNSLLKNPQKGVQNGPKFKCGSSTQEGHSALLECRSAHEKC